MSKPTPEALEALRLSVLVWHKKLEDFRKGKWVSLFPREFPCCRLFYAYSSSETCRGCAIHAFTGRTWCGGTPYKAAVDEYNSGHRRDAGAAILAELNFLKQLYEYYTMERK